MAGTLLKVAAPAPGDETLRVLGGLPFGGGLGANGTIRGVTGPRFTDPRVRRHHREPEPVDKPPSWAVLTLAAGVCAGLRRWFRAG